jgi:hypothetical protein
MYLMSISSPSMRVIEPGVIPPSMWAWGKENISVKILFMHRRRIQYYVPYSFLLISDNFCNGVERSDQGH